MNKIDILKTTGKWTVALIIPIFILISVSRLLMTPLFIQLEYRMPGFPEDGFGFSREDRLEYAPYAVDYLMNKEGIEYLGDLEFENGGDLFNERELSHMVDVKDLVQAGVRVWWVLLLFFVLVGVVNWRWELLDWFRSALSLGGLVTVCFLILVSLIGILSFNTLFTNFHRIFFEDGTWLFYYSDTLLRLFPIRFWQDAVIAEVLLSAAAGAGIWLGLRKKETPDE
jgi:integral membrane protein (TIGR01906 family)